MNVAPDVDSLQPDLSRARSRLEQARRVPVYRKFVSDTITPVSAYLALSDGAEERGFLLESVEKGENLARYSFLSVNPRGEVILDEDGLRTRGDLDIDSTGDPLDSLSDYIEDWTFDGPAELPGFTGGLVGFMGYEMIQYIEPSVPVKPPDDRTDYPDIHLYLTDRMVIFDHVKRVVYLVGHLSRDEGTSLEEQYEREGQALKRWSEKLEQTPERPPVSRPSKPMHERLSSNFEPDQFQDAVRSIKENIRSGDIFQAVLSQRFTLQDPNHPFNLYRRLRSVNPSPYMFYLDYRDFQLVGSSPEILVQVEGDQARVRPIAGTRRRGDSPEEDEKLARELSSDHKEQAEHTMLVDLGRNDLGRICRAGSVEVTERAYIERYSHVMHMVSNVEGVLREDSNAIDVLRATFPAGTVTGAPKVRAMQILEDLEPDRRGPYAGAVGYVSYQGNLDTCIVIRTILSRAGTLDIQAGAGIVADSHPKREYEETREKARALIRAVETLPDTPFL